MVLKCFGRSAVQSTAFYQCFGSRASPNRGFYCALATGASHNRGFYNDSAPRDAELPDADLPGPEIGFANRLRLKLICPTLICKSASAEADLADADSQIGFG